MKIISTKGKSAEVELSKCFLDGLAPDGGLYVPTYWPDNLKNFETDSFVDYAYEAISPYFKGDEYENDLASFIEKAFDFPINLNFFEDEHALLELFHGPTAAFKDFGARFLAEVLNSMGEKSGEKTILVATSGDTGGAVASAFFNKPGINVIILYPSGMVSPLQEQQLTCWGGNVKSFRVKGSFDDCQRLVKSAFNDKTLREKYQLTSANSINLGRLLPQMAYHGYSSSLFKKKIKKNPNLVIPTGNLGNGFGAFWALKMGAPIERIMMASNANETVSNFFDSGKYRAAPSISTLANAMDVGDPSNIERLLHLIPDFDKLKKLGASFSVTDLQIKEELAFFYKKFQVSLCPHTAVGTYVGKKYFKELPYIVSATAHPGKFKEIVEPEIQKKLCLPEQLEKLMSKSSFVKDIDANLEELFSYI